MFSRITIALTMVTYVCRLAPEAFSPDGFETDHHRQLLKDLTIAIDSTVSPLARQSSAACLTSSRVVPGRAEIVDCVVTRVDQLLDQRVQVVGSGIRDAGTKIITRGDEDVIGGAVFETWHLVAQVFEERPGPGGGAGRDDAHAVQLEVEVSDRCALFAVLLVAPIVLREIELPRWRLISWPGGVLPQADGVHRSW